MKDDKGNLIADDSDMCKLLNRYSSVFTEEDFTTELTEVSQKFQSSVNEILSDINLDEDLITLKLLGLKKHKSPSNDSLVPHNIT